MFAGIVELVGSVVAVDAAPRSLAAGNQAYRLAIDLGPLAEGLPRGASVAVNGACLTLTECQRSVGSFDVVPETWRRTTLARLQPRDPVNLERSLKVGDRIDGHFVQGHVDGIGTVDRVDRAAGQWKLWVQCPPEAMPMMVPKGSVAIDGTSLTIVDVQADRISVALVPTTLERTVLGRRRPGEPVNLETDILARLVLARLAALVERGAPASAGLTLEKLMEGGYVR